MAPPVVLHWVVQVLDSSFRQVVKLLSWHFSWQLAFAVAVQDPSHDPLHLAVQSALVETEVHVVVQWSLQHALQEAVQSAEADAVDPSGPDDAEADAEHDSLQPDSHVLVQSVVQLNVLLLAQLVEQPVWQLVSQVASAEAVHWELHCSSSLLAQACSQLSGAHSVEQLFCTTRTQLALASMSMSPQAEMLAALAARGVAQSAPTARTVDVYWSQRREVVFIPADSATSEPVRMARPRSWRCPGFRHFRESPDAMGELCRAGCAAALATRDRCV